MATTFIIDTDELYIESLKVIESKYILVTETDTDYIILNCNPFLEGDEDSISRRINALILNDNTREVIAIGPSKPYTLEKFKKQHGDKRKSIEVTEMVEGLFFQLFWDERICQWEIGTQNSVFGNYSYYRMPHVKATTYRTMIVQAMGLSEEEDLNEWKGLKYMDKKYCYHFVLQHADNHLVFKIIEPAIYIIGAFEMHANKVKNNIRYIPTNEYKNTFPASMNLVKFPTVLRAKEDEEVDKYDVLIEEFVSIQQPNTRMGIVIQHVSSGDTTVVFNPAYIELQQVRGTHPNILYHYLCLKKMKKTDDFLRLFMQYKVDFTVFEHLYESLISKLHQSYVDHFVIKKQTIIHKKYYYHIKQLHSTIFIPSLRDEKKVIIRKNVVRKYVDGLEVGHILHILQHELYIMQSNHEVVAAL